MNSFLRAVFPSKVLSTTMPYLLTEAEWSEHSESSREIEIIRSARSDFLNKLLTCNGTLALEEPDFPVTDLPVDLSKNWRLFLMFIRQTASALVSLKIDRTRLNDNEIRMILKLLAAHRLQELHTLDIVGGVFLYPESIEYIISMIENGVLKNLNIQRIGISPEAIPSIEKAAKQHHCAALLPVIKKARNPGYGSLEESEPMLQHPPQPATYFSFFPQMPVYPLFLGKPDYGSPPTLESAVEKPSFF